MLNSTKQVLTAGFTLATIVGTTTAFAAPVFLDRTETSEAVDPLTCYIATDGASVNPDSVTLTCGGGVEAHVNLNLATPSYEPSLPLGDVEVTRAAVGTSTVGSAIVRLWVDAGDETCTYYRDLASPPQETDITCL